MNTLLEIIKVSVNLGMFATLAAVTITDSHRTQYRPSTAPDSSRLLPRLLVSTTVQSMVEEKVAMDKVQRKGRLYSGLLQPRQKVGT